MFFGTVVWCGAAQNFKSLEAARILGSFFAGAGEGLAEVVVADLFFLHERGWWMSVCLFFLLNTSIITIGTGFLITAKGWRWLFWVSPFASQKIDSTVRIDFDGP
jgi:MFS family permease